MKIGVIIFGSVRFLSKKITKPKFFFLKKKPKPGQTDRFRFGSVFLGQKPVQTDLARFFRFWLGFLGFGSVFSVWRGFSGLARFFVGFGSVRFFWFFGYKTETEPAGFFKNLIGLIGFFFRFGFFGYFFFLFSRFSRFFGFFAHP